MNGYTSVNAAITIEGHKKSLPAQAAAGVFLDLEVLAAAPVRLIRAGLGDSLCRCTAQADWLLAHLLLGRPYRLGAVRAAGRGRGRTWSRRPKRWSTGDLEAIRRLVRTLVLSGFGMTLCGGSDPASQGEHLISHYVDMMGDPAWPENLHGEQIGVTTLSMAGLQARLLDGPPPRIQPSAVDEAALIAPFRPRARALLLAGVPSQARRPRALRSSSTSALPSAGTRSACGSPRSTGRPSSCARSWSAPGPPTRPEALGWPRDFYGEAVRHAREIRNRYTFLDLAADGGVLDRLGAAG